MNHSREYIEETIVNRLQKVIEGDRHVSAYQFREVSNRLDVVIYRVLEEVTIPSFTEEDLTSFMLMKTHQMLRQDKIDLDRQNWQTLCYRAFKNLMVDIHRMQLSAHRRGLALDPLDERADRHIDEEKASLLIMTNV